MTAAEPAVPIPAASTPAARAGRWAKGLVVPSVGGEAMFPLVVLSLLYFFDEFDTAAFGTLAPDIQKAFKLNDNDFGLLIVVNTSVTALLAVPFSYLSDRVRRTPLVVICGVIAGVFSLMTGVVGTVPLLAMARFGNGVGLLANGPTHNSLIADHYSPEHRPEGFAYHTNALYLGGIVGPLLAGAVGAALGWRAVFYVLLIPMLITTFVVATRLKEPRRGATDDAEAALRAELEQPPSFVQASKALLGISTLRYQYAAAIPFGAGLIPLAIYLPLFYERVFGLDTGERGVLGGVAAIFTFAGVRWGGRLTPKWFGSDMGEPLRKASIVLAIEGVGLLAFAVSPWLWLSVAFACVNSLIIGLFFAPFYATQALVSPARVRSLSFSFVAIFLVLGVIVFFGVGLGKVSDAHGIRWGISCLTPFWLVGAAILYRSGRHVNDDTLKAISALTGG